MPWSRARSSAVRYERPCCANAGRKARSVSGTALLISMCAIVYSENEKNNRALHLKRTGLENVGVPLLICSSLARHHGLKISRLDDKRGVDGYF